MLDKILGWGKKKQQNTPSIHFGRYSDNNKTLEKTKRWTDADNFFKEKKYEDSFEAFFDYLRDEDANNVITKKEEDGLSFEIYQGSKVVRGKAGKDGIKAEVSLAKMPMASVAVMRRLLDQNFTLYYSRYALDKERLCMRFDSDIETANPSKLYYAFRELSIKADKQDDLLVQDFSSLQSLDTEHIVEIPLAEKEIKYTFFKKWITETIDYVNTLDAEKMCGGIAYMLLNLAFKIDYLICPEGAFLSELEKIPGIYFTQQERPTTEKNKDMLAAYTKLLTRPEEDIYKNLFRSRSSFSVVMPQSQKAISEAITGANNNMIWYRDNDYLKIAAQICEYGIAYCQYSFSLPRPLTELFHLLIRVNNADYFAALGFNELLYDTAKNKIDGEAIIKNIFSIQKKWQKKYPKLSLKTTQLRFDNLVNFNHSFTTELEQLNFDSK